MAVQLSSVLMSNYLTIHCMLLRMLHLSIHHYIAVSTLCMVAECCSIFHGGHEVVFPDQGIPGIGSCFKYIMNNIFFFYAE
jgi:hypothetical protein